MLGSLFIGGISIRASMMESLLQMGVRDSKLLTPDARAGLYRRLIRSVEGVCVARVPAGEIDLYVSRAIKYRRLNYLEAIKMAEVIDSLSPAVAYVDAADASPARFRANILSFMNRKVHLVATHKADRAHPVVSAASIVAKWERDREVANLSKTYGPMGSGYPSDARTINFIAAWLSTKGHPPEFARMSWRTMKRMLARYVPSYRARTRAWSWSKGSRVTV